MRMRRILLSSGTGLVLPYIYTLSHEWHEFGQDVPEGKLCILIFFTTLCETFLILRRIQKNLNLHSSLRNVPFILVRFK
jgi:hypothetical protein